MPRQRKKVDVLPRLRLMQGDVILLGPGKADLLEAIGRAGSIRAAAVELGMSYMRAWSLVRTMNGAFREPLVESTRGGGGGASLTPEGTEVLALYRRMQQRALRAVAPLVEEIEKKI
jgi:molybdate transport system regulatory protein